MVAFGVPGLAGAGESIEEIVVTGQLRERALESLAASVSVLPARLIERRGAEHLEQLLDAAPNVNFNLGASRGKFVQLRGVGERSQFVDPVDPSVGLYIDGIDFSGLGGAGTLFGIEQVEVLRGPQGTAFGASAMAGMLNLRSAAPADAPSLRLRAGAAEYAGRVAGVDASAPLGDSVGARLVLERHRSDGYVENDHLGSDDTNAIDESTARARLAWQPRAALALGLGLIAVDADNGYDAWSLDNTRHTLSDQPGRDRQRTFAAVLDARWSGWSVADVVATVTANDTDLDYGYDEDWSYPGLCTGTPCEGWEYASTDRYLRGIDARSVDLRLLSRGGGALDWVAGLYTTTRDTALERRYGSPFFDSDWRSTRDAAYAEIGWQARAALRLTAGLRAERFEGDYDDSLGVAAGPSETQYGGQLSAQYETGRGSMVYALVSRGFKAGGVNGEARGKAVQGGFDPAVLDYLASHTEYGSEVLWNHEIGWKQSFADGRGTLRAAAFLMRREDVQLKAWYNDGPLFVGYTDNAARGSNRGAELELALAPRGDLALEFSLGLLDTHIEDFATDDPDTPDFDPAERGGREQAQAPHWQFHAAAEWAFLPRWFARAEVEGKDSAYASDSDLQRRGAYRLLHLSAGWRGERLRLGAWLRNALDEEYAVHGFYFGNDPRSFYANRAWWQYGPPRVAGLAVDYVLGE
jgi:outer membrane receptor protein involved in Fe transport